MINRPLERSVVLLFTAVMAMSCNSNIPERNDLDWTIPTEGPVIVTFPAVSTTGSWAAGDQVSVFDDVNGRSLKSVYVVNNSISAEVEASAGRFCALYPSDENSDYSKEDAAIIAEILPEQTALAGEDTGKGIKSIAEVSSLGGEFQFKEVTSGLTFSVEDEDVVAVEFTTNNETALAGKVALRYNEGTPSCTILEGEGTTVLRAKGNQKDGTFSLTDRYFVEAIPQDIKGGMKVKCYKKDDTVSSCSVTSDVSIAPGKAFNIGAIHCVDYFSPYDQYTKYIKEGRITIAGKEYTYPDTPAVLVGAEDVLKTILAGTDKSGIYFLPPGVDFDMGGVAIQSDVVLIGNYSNVKSGITFLTNASMSVSSGSLTLANLVFSKGARTAYWIGNASKDGSPSAFVMDDCLIDNISAYFWYSTSKKYSISNISITNCRIIVGPSGKNQMFNLASSTLLSGFTSFRFSDNIMWAKSSEDIQLLNANSLNSSKQPNSSNTLSNMDMVVENNIFYNLSSSTASPGLSGLLLRTYSVKSLHVKNNIFAMSTSSGDLNDCPFFTLHGEQESSTIRGFVLADSSETGSNYIWDMTGKGITNNAASSILYSAGLYYNSTDHQDKKPFSRVDLDNGNFTLNPVVEGYGPRN